MALAGRWEAIKGIALAGKKGKGHLTTTPLSLQLGYLNPIYFLSREPDLLLL